jgi:hypothetical protein
MSAHDTNGRKRVSLGSSCLCPARRHTRASALAASLQTPDGQKSAPSEAHTCNVARPASGSRLPLRLIGDSEQESESAVLGHRGGCRFRESRGLAVWMLGRPRMAEECGDLGECRSGAEAGCCGVGLTLIGATACT